MVFWILLCLTAMLGAGIGAVVSQLPGKRGIAPLRAALLLAAGTGLFVLGICLLGRSTDRTFLLDRFFPDRLSKLAGCLLLLLLLCLLGFLWGVLRAGGLRRYFRAVQTSRLHRGLGIVLLGGGLAAALGCVILAGDPTPTPLRITELCSANFSLLMDPDTGEYSDYIELTNTGDAPVDIGGYFLSDNGKKRNRFRLPSLMLEPGACLVLWADGSGISGEMGETQLHLNFSLRPGETVWLSSPYGTVLDHVTVPERYKNVSLTRKEDGWILAGGTPGYANDSAVLFVAPTLKPPVFSLASGFYDDPQILTISAPAGCEIRYTLDGSEPTAESLLYDGPMTLVDISDQPNRVLNHPTTTLDRSGVITEPVDKGTLLRAAVFDAGGGRSETVTAVYFVGKETFSKYDGVRVLNITAAPIDLFGNYGIAVTGLDYDRWLDAGGEGTAPFPFFYRRGRKLEKNADVLLWDADHRQVLQQACGIRLQGDHTRAAVFKRFRLISRKIYSGSYQFTAPIFGSSLSHSFFTRQDTADIIAQQLCAGLDLGGLDAEPAAVFVNGEFYYRTYLRERYDKQYFTTYFGVDRDDVVIISNNTLDKGSQEDYEEYLDFLRYLEENDCADPAVYAEVCRQMDVRNYARFITANIYCNNTDWSVYKNYKMWRTRSADGTGVKDGRWRWLVYDMDGCEWTRPAFGDASRTTYDIFTYPAPYTEEPFLEMPVLRSLLRSPDFRDLFARTWLEMMNVTLTPDRARAILDRYGITNDSFWIGFLTKRPPYAADILVRDLDLSGEKCFITLSTSDPEGGKILLNDLSAPIPDSAQGVTWITGIPVTLTAEPAEGWRFVGWRGAAEGTDPIITLTPEGDTELIPVFQRE